MTALTPGTQVKVTGSLIGANRRFAGRHGTLESPVDISTVSAYLDGDQSAGDPEWVVRFGPNETATLATSNLEVV